MTRHGAGPFPTEDKNLWYADNTNVTRDFQGTLRFGKLDPHQLALTVRQDFLQIEKDMSETLNVTVPHLDQVSEPERDRVLHSVMQLLIPDSLFTSYGPSRSDVKQNLLTWDAA